MEIVILERVTALPNKMAGRPPRGWQGGKQLIEDSVINQPHKFVLPEGLTYSKVRYGLYKAGRALGVIISIRRVGNEIFFQCTR